jgi:hypothetical protein
MNQHLTSYQGDKTPATGAVAPRGRLSFDLMDPTAFQHIQRVAVMYANSPLFPDHLRKGGQQTAIANAVLVMNIAERLREDPLTVAQQIYFVGGKPGWAATYMIAKANQHGVFKNPIDWKVTGEKETLSVTAHAELASTGKKVEVTVDMETAKAEGWTRNSKYQSMPEQMLRYRSATALIRLYCPEVMIGVPPANEVEDNHYSMRDVTPEPQDEPAPSIPVAKAPAREEANVEDAEMIEDEPEPAKQVRKPVDRTPPKPAEKAKEPDPVVDEPEGKEPEGKEPEGKEPEGKEPEPAEEAEKPAPKPAPKPKQEAQADMLAPEPEEKPAPKKNFDAIRKAVMADLEASGGDITGVIGFYGTDLIDMRDNAKDVFDALEKEIGVDLSSEL